ALSEMLPRNFAIRRQIESISLGSREPNFAGESALGRSAVATSTWNHCWLIRNYGVIPGVAMRCEAEHCDGKGTHSPKELLRCRMGALPEPWSRFARHGSPGMTRIMSHTSTRVGTRESDFGI